MKRIIAMLSLVGATLLMSAVPILAAEEGVMGAGSKDECLLVSMNCGDRVDSINQRIERLNREISKGTAVYTGDELRNLNKKLEEDMRLLESLIHDS
jgi:hypothetical protein